MISQHGEPVMMINEIFVFGHNKGQKNYSDENNRPLLFAFPDTLVAVGSFNTVETFWTLTVWGGGVLSLWYTQDRLED